MNMLRIMILGGTSGIGRALAGHYLHDGHMVAVCGRDLSKLELREPRLQTYALDIADKAAVTEALRDFSQSGLDLLIVSAGFYFNSRHEVLDAATSLRMLQTNVSGLVHAFDAAAQIMCQQSLGDTQQVRQLVAISSVAGLLKHHPGASLYSATKRSVLNLCETYRLALAPFSIAVTAIVPGYVDTTKLRALNNGDAQHKPFLMSERAAVAIIVDAIHRRQPVCVFPWQMRWLIRFANCLPKSCLRWR